MPAVQHWTWKKLGTALFSPKAEGAEAKFNEIKQRLPVPVFWLLGKTQAGKTSVIRALTGNDAAEIGNGFQPCTQRSQFYDFPSSQQPLIRFLDTRGLGETAYEPEADLAWCNQQAHLLIVVIRALDMNQAAVLEAVRGIHRQQPNWPLIVVQTALHEAYPADVGHTQPYPYRQTPLPATVPHALAQALLHQRDWFQGLPARFVAVDLTLPEDGYPPADYGLEALWEAIEAAIPDTVLGLLRNDHHYKALLDFHARKAHPQVIGHALANAMLGAVPAAGLPLVLAVQAKLLHGIAHLYGLPLTRRLFSEFSALLGIGGGLGLLGRELVKLVPGYGWAVAGAYSGAATYALGRAFCLYLHGVKRGAMPDRAQLRHAYRQAFADARRQLLRQRQG